MKPSKYQFEAKGVYAEIRVDLGHWVADATVTAYNVDSGGYGSARDARIGLVKTLRSLADSLEAGQEP
jgi:hypothetical protein